LEQQFARARVTRESLLRDALTGRLTPQNAKDEPASILLERAQIEKIERQAQQRLARRRVNPAQKVAISMKAQEISCDSLSVAWDSVFLPPLVQVAEDNDECLK
jgi:type I restriction enzyme S subunit